MASTLRFDNWENSNGDLIGTAANGYLGVPGTILQVVQGSLSTTTSSNSTSYVDTGLSASITPSSTSSKILVMVSQPMYIDEQGVNTPSFMYHQILRDTTSIREVSYGTRDKDTTNYQAESTSGAIMHLDSPNTTSSVTYKTQVKGGTGINNMTWSIFNTTGTIILMEVAG